MAQRHTPLSHGGVPEEEDTEDEEERKEWRDCVYEEEEEEARRALGLSQGPGMKSTHKHQLPLDLRSILPGMPRSRTELVVPNRQLLLIAGELTSLHAYRVYHWLLTATQPPHKVGIKLTGHPST